MKIYFKNQEGSYQYPIFENSIKNIYKIVALYWKVVPKILITDSDDFACLEIENNRVINQEQEDIEKIEKRLNDITSEKKIYTNINELVELYKVKKDAFFASEDFNLVKELTDLHINISALIASNQLPSNSFRFENIDSLIETVEFNIPGKLEDNYFPYLEGIRDSSKTLVILPLSRVVFEGRPFCTDKYQFIPPKTIDYRKIFNIESNLYNGLRTKCRDLTLFSVDKLYNSYCIAFMYDLNWNEFRGYPNHKGDVTILKLLSDSTNEYFHLINFYGCSLNSPDSLPAEVGSWVDSNDYLGAFLFNIQEGAYYIAGSAIESSRVVKGLGLEIGDIIDSASRRLIEYTESEVSKVTKYALTLYNDALYSHNKTNKFIKMMTLFEYLAFPYEYKKFKEAKKYVFCHSVKDKNHYHELSERFKVFSEEYRTAIIHNGQTLELVIPDYDEREKLLNEIEKYFKVTISSMFSFI